MDYVRSKGIVDINQMATELHYDIPDFLKNETIQYLLTRQLLIKADNYSNKYKLSDTAINLLDQLDKEDTQQKELKELEVENFRLQNDKIKYEATLRKQGEEISRLTATNLRLQNKNLRRTIVVVLITGLLVFISSNWQWALSAIHKIFQR